MCVRGKYFIQQINNNTSLMLNQKQLKNETK